MPKVIFQKNQQFFPSVKASVETYFAENNIKKTGNWSLFLKTLILIPLALFIYVYLLTGNYQPIIGIMLSLVLGFTLALIGFNIMHDACHGSFSSKKWVNELMSYTMNGLGANAFLWKIKHNVIHHTYTNVDGIDDDIAKSPFLRQCESQKWVPLHRFQHIYMMLLYALNTIIWVFVTDSIKYFQRKIVVTEVKISTKEHVIFWISKILTVFFYIALPIMLVGWQYWLVGYLLMHAVLGITLSLVFQLAHVVENTSFEEVDHNSIKQIQSEWAEHEVRTTSNFATNSKVISWLVGGLNFQIEHHLFPRVSHVHYPAISKIVEQECAKFGLPYNAYPTMSSAVASHIRTMKQLGSKR
jgi:linoleoyl-CoA desaturase